MTSPVRPSGVSADEVALREGDIWRRLQEILCRIETDRMREKQHLVQVIRQLRLLNCARKTVTGHE